RVWRVFAQDHISPWGDGEVVTVLQDFFVGRLCEELEFSRSTALAAFSFMAARNITEHLAVLLWSAIRAGEIDFIVSVPHPFTASKACCSLIESLVAEVVLR